MEQVKHIYFSAGCFNVVTIRDWIEAKFLVIINFAIEGKHLCE